MTMRKSGPTLRENVCVCMCVYMYVHVCMCMCVYMYVHVCLYVLHV